MIKSYWIVVIVFVKVGVGWGGVGWGGKDDSVGWVIEVMVVVVGWKLL
jgi:hypothetical protein